MTFHNIYDNIRASVYCGATLHRSGPICDQCDSDRKTTEDTMTDKSTLEANLGLKPQNGGTAPATDNTQKTGEADGSGDNQQAAAGTNSDDAQAAAEGVDPDLDVGGQPETTQPGVEAAGEEGGKANDEGLKLEGDQQPGTLTTAATAESGGDGSTEGAKAEELPAGGNDRHPGILLGMEGDKPAVEAATV